MPHPSDLLMFATALVAVYLLPGPDMALVVATSARHGVRNGLLTALGLALSRTLHVVLSGLGLAALLRTQPLLFDAVRWLGAAYLLFLAWRIQHADTAPAATPLKTAGFGLSALRRGILTNLLNPKALMFCALLLPQFISADQDAAAQYLLLGVLLVATGLAFDAVYALSAASLSTRLAHATSLHKVGRLLFSGVFGFAALRLAVGTS